MAAIRREVVRRRQWISDDDYLEVLGLAQLLPGSNPTNTAVLIGQRLAGLAGAISGLIASVLPGFVILMIIGAFALDSHQAWVRGALRGCAATAVGLTLANVIELTLKKPRAVELAILVAVFAAALFAHLSLALTLIVFVPLTFAINRIIVTKPAA
jgi:chromate transporter